MTGLSFSEELQAETVDVLGGVVDLLLRANFEEPKGGWSEPLRVRRPKLSEQEEEEREEAQTTTASDVVGFIEHHRER